MCEYILLERSIFKRMHFFVVVFSGKKFFKPLFGFGSSIGCQSWYIVGNGPSQSHVAL